ncbi:hypothetical protein LOTGIDRAFT_117504 [Lottia gigantea]|uniref:tRNA N(3)-methylcytidine methyltransferase n=1 Tax=Lottia gigantea TaxID=225164 RepID=V4AJV5_LOTGI|nr:hypothetical protein LOTGIDRAFT_117504 [Lottia gigantea]ESO95010.1 hypothetical protein LOTGIDRAFT_117504 [Lottia gigantea]
MCESVNPTSTHSVSSSNKSKEDVKPIFGNRLLTNESDVFQHNSWDHVVWDDEQKSEAKMKTIEQAANALSLEEQEKFENKADEYWDVFYNNHKNKFFKDRHWLFTEFFELNCKHFDQEHQSPDTSLTKDQCDVSVEFPGKKAKYRFLEVGCGVGNTVFPVIETNNNPDLMMYCCDFSSVGISHVKSHPDYDETKCHAFVCDVSDPNSPLPFPEFSLDVVILIYVLSAIHPDKMQTVINRLCRHLKPGGMILFRDYGRYDLAQLRFKDGRCLSENFYVRGDGTRVYFFEQEELKHMFESAGLEEVQNIVDRRLQVNRGKRIKMYRVWNQCKYKKPIHADTCDMKPDACVPLM